ncbi:MAG: succinate dehydrogenase cytochrome b subunit [Candidatus Hydrogenedentes bacterium]|nr:succinate dehydrogenase cytochrome b subunit [Candidatus Hydrogenedentota bacterium]
MSTRARSYFLSSVFKKQIIAVTGLALVGFIIVHLSGNLLILLGPEAFNNYAQVLHTLPELLWAARIGLIAAFVLHVVFTIKVTLENRRARGGTRYTVAATHGRTNFAKKSMILTGLFVFFFLFFHLSDFAVAEKLGPYAMLRGTEYELYGLVWNGFSNPIRVLFYLGFVWCVGIHLSHGIQSLFQSLGFFHDRYTPLLSKVSLLFGLGVAAGFSVIPIYVFVRNLIGGPPV